MNKPKYALVNGHDVIGLVWEDEQRGRTIVLNQSLDFNYYLTIHDFDTNKKVFDFDFIKFIQDMLPIK